MKAYELKINKNPDALFEKCGFIPLRELTREEKVEVLKEKYSYYKDIVSLKKKNYQLSMELIKEGDDGGLKHFSNREIVDFLKIDSYFFTLFDSKKKIVGRKFLLELITSIENNNFSTLPFNPEFALNKAEPHLFMLNDRTERDEENPYISFMIDINKGEYLTFFLDELTECIREESYSNSIEKEKEKERKRVVFSNPSEVGIKFFSLKQIKFLKNILEQYNKYNLFSYITLLEKIGEYEERFKEQNKGLTRFISEYHSLTQEDKFLCLRYFTCMFLLSQYLRWWRGPSTPFIYEWKEERNKTKEEITFREQMIVEMLNELDHVRNVSGNKIFLEELKWLDYDFLKGGVKIGDLHLTEIFKSIRKGDFCIADASDRFSRSSVGYIFLLEMNKKLDDKAKEEDFKIFSAKVNLVIMMMLSKYNIKINIFHEFIPTKFERSGHIDPTHGKKYEGEKSDDDD